MKRYIIFLLSWSLSAFAAPADRYSDSFDFYEDQAPSVKRVKKTSFPSKNRLFDEDESPSVKRAEKKPKPLKRPSYDDYQEHEDEVRPRKKVLKKSRDEEIYTPKKSRKRDRNEDLDDFVDEDDEDILRDLYGEEPAEDGLGMEIDLEQQQKDINLIVKASLDGYKKAGNVVLKGLKKLKFW